MTNSSRSGTRIISRLEIIIFFRIDIDAPSFSILFLSVSFLPAVFHFVPYRIRQENSSTQNRYSSSGSESRRLIPDRYGVPSLFYPDSEHPFQIQRLNILPVYLQMNSLIVKTSEKHDPVPIRPNASRSIPHLNLVFGQSPVNVVQPGLLTGSQKCVRNTVLTYFHLYGSVLIGISQIKKVIIPVIVLLPSSIYFNQRRFRYCRY